MARIAVVGDACVDRFVYGTVARLAPDLPVPVMEIQDVTENKGMAANVWAGIRALGLGEAELWAPQSWERMSKTRYVELKSNHTFLRVDSSQAFEPLDIDSFPAEDYDFIIVSDYDKGFLTAEALEQLSVRNPKVYLDTKKLIGDWAEGVAVLKINEPEFDASRAAISPTLMQRTIVTLGARGALYQGDVFPVRPVAVRDLSGAGDSFFAGLVVALVRGLDIQRAIEFANQVGRLAVSNRGVVSVTREMLVAANQGKGVFGVSQ